MSEQNPNEWLMQTSVKSATFKNVGDTITGTIAREPNKMQQRDYDTGEPLVWNDGNAREMLVVIVQTDLQESEDDDGLRGHYLSGKKRNAVADAVRKSGSKGLSIGGKLTVTYTGDGPKTNPKFNAPKLFSAVYVPPADEAFGGGFGTTAQAAPAATGPVRPSQVPEATWALLDDKSKAMLSQQYASQNAEPPF